MFDLTRPWPPGFSRRNGVLLIAGFALLIAALYWLDRPLSIFGTGLPEPVRAGFGWLTQWGESDWILYPSLVLLVAFLLLRFLPMPRLRAGFGQLAAVAGFVFLGVGLPGLASTLLKRLIGRGRPEVYHPELPLAFRWNLSDYDYQSFPSGHATTSFALAMVAAFLFPRLALPALAMAVLIRLFPDRRRGTLPHRHHGRRRARHAGRLRRPQCLRVAQLALHGRGRTHRPPALLLGLRRCSAARDVRAPHGRQSLLGCGVALQRCPHVCLQVLDALEADMNAEHAPLGCPRRRRADALGVDGDAQALVAAP
jgi:membrane-associated phospholipid phosphatase